MRYDTGTEQEYTLHRSRDRRPHQTIEPMVIRLFGALLPFIDTSPTGFGLDEIL
jgi:hypothetical protein